MNTRTLLAGITTLSLVACGHSVPVTQNLAVGVRADVECNTTSADHSAQSLPYHVEPHPGPTALYLPPPRAPQLENTGVWTAPPILISGASAYRCGEFLYQDWLFDDHGALGPLDPNDPQAASAYLFSPKTGTLTYPTDAVYANNAADLVEFRVKPQSDATLFRITLNTLQDPERVAFTLALGTSAEALDWPHDAGVSSPAEWFLTVHGMTAELVSAADGNVQNPAPTLTVDLERRQFEIRVAHQAWNPGTGRVRMAAGVGLWDAAANAYLKPSLTASATAPGGALPISAALFNLAFRASEPIPEFGPYSGRTIADAAVLSRVQGRWWREYAQAQALALGDVSAFFTEVDFDALARGAGDESAVPKTGFMNRIFASRYVFGQGVDYLKECGGISAARPCDGAMVGQLQPYTLYVPEKPAPAGGYGLTLLLHALSANLNQYLGSRHAQSLGERGTGSLVVTPAGRGPDGFYFDVAEADMFEVWADVARHYPLDPDWTVMSGYSMGGIGTFRLAPRYPDLFARIMPIVAAAGDAEEKLASLRNVPVMMSNSTFDELQPVVSTEGTVTALNDLGYRYDVMRFETWDHLSPATNDFYPFGVEFLGEARVERNPARITYVLAPAEDEPRVDVIADKAYWLSDLRLRDAAAGTGSIDARSEGLGLAEPVVLAPLQTNGLLTGGYLEPAPFTRRQLTWMPATPALARNRLVIQARNIATVTVHPQRVGLDCNAEIELDSDGPMGLRLAGCN
ncbi:MAG: glucodextranase DOMON-like domain-containing protein [Pseudomonadota bacterium]